MTVQDIANVETKMIRSDGGTQMRVRLDMEAVADYAESMSRGDRFPPVVLFYDGTYYWIGDGFHRIEAVRRNDGRTILADVRAGTRHDAIAFAIGANRVNGMRRTNADKAIAVRAALSHPEIASWGSRRIADLVGVSHVFVDKTKSQLETVTSSDSRAKPPTKTIGIDGKARSAPRIDRRTVDTAKEHLRAKRDLKEAQRKRNSDAVRAGRPVPRPRYVVCPRCNGKGHIENTNEETVNE